MPLLLTAGPLLFLAIIAWLTLLLVVRGVSPKRASGRVAAYAPHILLGVLCGLFALLLLRYPDAVRAAWKLPPGRNVIVDVVVGLAVGTPIGFAYIGFLGRWLERAQRRFGDYVPPGEVLATVSGSAVPFFAANILLAPLVEETLYRAVAIPTFAADHGVAAAVVVSSLAFGLLHWPGGLWYMLLTGPLLGGVLAALYLWSDSIVAPLAAHLALNVVEFGQAIRLRRRSPKAHGSGRR